MHTWKERLRRWFDCIRGYDTYIHVGMEFHLPAVKCDNLRQSDKLAALFRQSYLAKYGKRQSRAAGFLRDVQNASLMVLREFDYVCKKRGLVYMLHGGSLLGAWRHSGFIPWDDDIDVAMPRKDYEKIIDAFNADCRIPSLRAKLISPSRGVVFIKIEAVGEPMIYVDVFPCDCYAETLDQVSQHRLRECLDRISGKVLPDKKPVATYEYYADVRNKLGLTPVSHDDPECRTIVYLFECHYLHILPAEAIFPTSNIDFEGFTAPAPANTTAMLHAVYHDYESFPLSARSHLSANRPTTARMLNVKRFLRSDSFRFVAPIPGRANANEHWRDRFITFVRNAVSPIFTVLTHDTLKEYRFFSRKRFFRLRADKIIRTRLEMLDSYWRLSRDEQEFPLARGGTRQSQCASVDALVRVFRVCDNERLTCWLWLGSLLGAIRNGMFLYADDEAVLLMPRADYERFRPLFHAAPDMGDLRVELVQRYGGLATIVMQEGKIRVVVIPCDFCPDDWDRDTYARHMEDAANQADMDGLKAENDVDGLYRRYAADRERMGIGLECDRTHSLFPAWDCPELFEKSHILSATYYTPAKKWTFEGIESKVPADPDIVLTALYGDYWYHV